MERRAGLFASIGIDIGESHVANIEKSVGNTNSNISFKSILQYSGNTELEKSLRRFNVELWTPCPDSRPLIVEVPGMYTAKRPKTMLECEYC